MLLISYSLPSETPFVNCNGIDFCPIFGDASNVVYLSSIFAMSYSIWLWRDIFIFLVAELVEMDAAKTWPSKINLTACLNCYTSIF